jgi:hypothetical protein
MSVECLPEGFSSSAARGPDGCHHATVADNHIGLPAPLHIVQDLREATRGIGGTQLLHKIRLSDQEHESPVSSRGESISLPPTSTCPTSDVQSGSRLSAGLGTNQAETVAVDFWEGTTIAADQARQTVSHDLYARPLIPPPR